MPVSAQRGQAMAEVSVQNKQCLIGQYPKRTMPGGTVPQRTMPKRTVTKADNAYADCTPMRTMPYEDSA